MQIRGRIRFKPLDINSPREVLVRSNCCGGGGEDDDGDDENDDGNSDCSVVITEFSYIIY